MGIPFSLTACVVEFLILLLSSSFAVDTIVKHDFSFKEATVSDFQLAFRANQLTSRQLVELYLAEIKKLNPLLKGVIEVNPDALHLAEKADLERKNKSPENLSDLHGIPILLKDNIATRDKLNTTAGSLALQGSVVAQDAGVVRKLREAGAIILGKASLSEWAHFRSFNATSGWCARSGQGKNPYVLRAGPCGSSSGSAISVAANMVAVSLGTETDGSILCPSSSNSVVGIKPTVGLTSRSGVVPISLRQDSVGVCWFDTTVDNDECHRRCPRCNSVSFIEAESREEIAWNSGGVLIVGKEILPYTDFGKSHQRQGELVIFRFREGSITSREDLTKNRFTEEVS